jgi:alkylhydroperoxidase family enzyme
MIDPKIAARQADIVGKPMRIQPLEDWTEEMRKLVSMPPGYEHHRPTMYGILLNHFDLTRVYKDMMTFFLLRGSLPLRDRELAILRTGWLRQVPFIWGEHVRIGKEVGLTAEEIERVREGSVAAGWTEHERAILKATEELVENAMVSDATWATLARTLEPKLLLELVAMVGQYQALGLIQNSLRIPLFEGNPGLTAA